MPVPRPTTRRPPRLRKQQPQLPPRPPVATINMPKPPKPPSKGVNRGPVFGVSGGLSHTAGGNARMRRGLKPRQPGVPGAAGSPSNPAAPQLGPDGRPAPPPESSQGYATRTAAQSTYSQALSGFKSGLVQAALQLGSPEILQALRNNPDYAEYVGVIDQGMVNPQSTLAQLKNQETQGLQEVDEGANEGNTFFSGIRLNNRGKLSDDFNTRRVGAVNDFVMGAQAEANRGIGGALSDYNDALNEALGYDISAALSGEPEAESSSGPSRRPRPSNASRSAAAASRSQAEAAKRKQQQAAAEAKSKRLKKKGHGHG